MNPQPARVLKLFPQLVDIHNLAKPHILRTVHQRERRTRPRKMLPDKLKHQQLVEIRIEQRSRNRIELPIMIVCASRQIDNHCAAILLNLLSKTDSQLRETFSTPLFTGVRATLHLTKQAGDHPYSSGSNESALQRIVLHKSRSNPLQLLNAGLSPRHSAQADSEGARGWTMIERAKTQTITKQNACDIQGLDFDWLHRSRSAMLPPTW